MIMQKKSRNDMLPVAMAADFAAKNSKWSDVDKIKYMSTNFPANI